MRALAVAFVLVYGSGLGLTALQALAIAANDSATAHVSGIAFSVVVAFVYPIGMNLIWWLAVALLVALRKGGYVGAVPAE